MPYLNVDPDYFTHPKTVRLIGLLGRGAEVLPLKLWAYVSKHHCGDGRLTGYLNQEIETLIGWWGEEGRAVQALVECGQHLGKRGFLEKDEKGLKVHDWKAHEGHISALRKKAKHAAETRWKEYRRKALTGNAPGMLKQSSKPAVPAKPAEGLAGNGEVSGEPPPGKSLFGDFPAERQRPKADELPNEGGEGWQLWVKAWEGHPPNARHLEPAGVLSILERKAKDSAVRPKLAHAMTLFRRSQQVKNKTLENFINTHFNTYLGQAKPEAPAVDPNREQALNKAYQSLYIYTKRTDKTPLTRDAIQALRTKAEALRAAGREWPSGFKMP